MRHYDGCNKDGWYVPAGTNRSRKEGWYQGQAARDKQLLKNSAPPITKAETAEADMDLLCKQLQF